MQYTNLEHLRVTAWPGGTVNVPPVKTYEVRLVDGQWLEYSPPGGGAVLPDELYLRQALDVDVADPEAIAEFVSSYGPLEVPAAHGHREFWSFLPYTDADASLRAAVAAKAKELGRGETWDNRLFGHVEEARMHLIMLRNCVAVWEEYARSDGKPHVDRLAWVGPDRPSSAIAAVHTLTEGVSTGLRPFQLHLELSVGERESASPFTLVRPTVYSAMCLQLFNHIAENAGYHRCQNETCGRRFVRQLGRAKLGQHRTVSVSYCTSSCAKAQMQREWRRRQKKRKAHSGAAASNTGEGGKSR